MPEARRNTLLVIMGWSLIFATVPTQAQLIKQSSSSIDDTKIAIGAADQYD